MSRLLDLLGTPFSALLSGRPQFRQTSLNQTWLIAAFLLLRPLLLLLLLILLPRALSARILVILNMLRHGGLGAWFARLVRPHDVGGVFALDEAAVAVFGAFVVVVTGVLAGTFV